MQADAAQVNPKKLFVGNVPFSATEEQLVDLFSQYGNVQVNLIVDRMSGRSKGIAFAEFDTEQEAQEAIDALNGYEMDGRPLVVNVARPKVPRDNRGGYNNRRGGDRGYNRH